MISFSSLIFGYKAISVFKLLKFTIFSHSAVAFTEEDARLAMIKASPSLVVMTDIYNLKYPHIQLRSA